MNKDNKAAQLLMILGGRRIKKEEVMLAEFDDLLVKYPDYYLTDYYIGILHPDLSFAKRHLEKCLEK